ncbi:MAG: sigma-54 dependent transcriptional regulator [Marinifilaceae bacterium]|jgi:DNA-binding NtrC family response regulator|nr:sigma-54 dependent transcriptional regulator [Marinifilaceae bacterium]
MNFNRKHTVLIFSEKQNIINEINHSKLDFNIIPSYEIEESIRYISNNNIDIAIIETTNIESAGFKLLDFINIDHQHINSLVINADNNIECIKKALKSGANDFLTNNYTQDQLINSIKENLLNNINSEIDDESRLIIGHSQSIKNTIQLINKVATANDTSVLITGESGTGKELVARSIHEASNRRNNYFHAVNCSAIPESLFESEFFGHTKGSFTGAKYDKAGWFEMAGQGSLFLDEIGDMPLNLQTKLLRVLEDKTIRKIGSNKDIEFTGRIIAATNQDLKNNSENGNFRLDLYHRLNSFVIQIDPLRERKEDIPELVEFFVKNLNKKLNKHISRIDKDVIEQMYNYDFPGNIRELRNIIERAMIISDNGGLSMKHFNFHKTKSGIDRTIKIADFNLKNIEKEYILKALERTHNNKSKAADLLDITWQSLDRRLKKHKIII